MPRRRLLSAPERASLLAVSTPEVDRIHFHLSESDLGVIRQRRGAHNRLGFAVQLCLLRHPGTVLLPGEAPPQDLLCLIARQLRVDPALWPKYAEREVTRREHLQELQTWLGVVPFGRAHHGSPARVLTEISTHTDQGSCSRRHSWSACGRSG